jgi:hypothetical protein
MASGYIRGRQQHTIRVAPGAIPHPLPASKRVSDEDAGKNALRVAPPVVLLLPEPAGGGRAREPARAAAATASAEPSARQRFYAARPQTRMRYPLRPLRRTDRAGVMTRSPALSRRGGGRLLAPRHSSYLFSAPRASGVPTTLICDLPGHADAGMKTALMVGASRRRDTASPHSGPRGARVPGNCPGGWGAWTM